MEHNLWALFRAIAASIPNRAGLNWRERSLTYGDLADRAGRFANVLASRGIGVHRSRAELEPWEIGQDTVGLYLLNGPEYLEATLGGYASRTAPFNINYRYVGAELAYLLDDANASALVYHARFAPTLAGVLPRLRRAPLLLQVSDTSGELLLPGAWDYERALAAARPTPPALEHDPDDLYILYTGGTTGMPKGVLWRQADLWMAALGGARHRGDTRAIAAAAEAKIGPRVLLNAPLMHGAAHWQALYTLLSGGTVLINGVVDRLDPIDAWSTLERERADTMVLIGEAFARPLLAELETGRYDASSLRLILLGGAITSPTTKERILASLPHVRIIDSAGASETGGALHQVSVAGTQAERGVFAPLPTVAVVNAERQHLLTPGHEGIGWLAKSGPIPLGYLGDPDKTAATFPMIEGVRWSIPGDRARLRADGMLELLGRDSVTINSAGEKIFAEEVEQAVLTHPDVVDVVVTCRPSERWGEEVVAVVELALGARPSDGELVAAAGTRIARFKLPKEIVRVPKLLRGPAGKADYRWARELVLARQRGIGAASEDRPTGLFPPAETEDRL